MLKPPTPTFQWQHIGGKLSWISSGRNIMFGVNSAGHIFYRAGITEDTPAGTGWVRVPGGLKQVDTYQSEVWGSNSASDVFKLDISCSGWSILLYSKNINLIIARTMVVFQRLKSTSFSRLINSKNSVCQSACMPVEIIRFDIKLISCFQGRRPYLPGRNTKLDSEK